MAESDNPEDPQDPPESPDGKGDESGWGDLFGESSAPGAAASLFRPPALEKLGSAKSPSLFVPPISQPKNSTTETAVSGAFGVPTAAASKAPVAESEDKEAAEPEDKEGAEPEDKETPEPEDKEAAEPEDKETPEPEDKEPEDKEAAEPEDKEAAELEDKEGAEPEDKETPESEDKETPEPEEPKSEDRAKKATLSVAKEPEPEPEPEPEELRSDEPSPRKESEPSIPPMAYILVGVGALVLFIVFVASGKNKDIAAHDKVESPRSNAGAKQGVPSSGAAAGQAPTEGPAPRRPDTTKTHDNGPSLAGPESNGSESGGEGAASESSGDTEGTDTDATGEAETAPTPAMKPKVDDPRAPSVIPPGTPMANRKAFEKLPVSIHDGAPVGAIGVSGIHIDAAEVGTGYDKGCTGVTSEFSISTDELANVCFRVVHPREDEVVRIFWEKDGVMTRRGKVKIRNIHAFMTRAYLKLRPEYVGSWQVRIVPEGQEDTNLAIVKFRIVE